MTMPQRTRIDHPGGEQASTLGSRLATGVLDRILLLVHSMHTHVHVNMRVHMSGPQETHIQTHARRRTPNRVDRPPGRCGSRTGAVSVSEVHCKKIRLVTGHVTNDRLVVCLLSS